MPESPRVVARLLDGKLLRGYTSDFRPDQDLFHVYEKRIPGFLRVAMDELKALFFVKTLRGNPRHVERKSFGPGQERGRRTWIEFHDGEELAGFCPEFDPSGAGLFLYPTDAKSNIEKAYVPKAAVKQCLFDAEAEKAAESYDPARRPFSVKRIGSGEWERMLGLTRSELRGPDRSDSEIRFSRRQSGSWRTAKDS